MNYPTRMPQTPREDDPTPSDAPEKEATKEAAPKQRGAMTKPQRKRIVIPILILVALAAAVVVGAILFSSGSDNTSGGITSPETVARRIDGVQVKSDAANRKPVAAMIENIVESRPQAGLDQAQLVYEALAEGGITRFMAVFATDASIEKIGPVRSARPYYLDWVAGLDAMYMHVGGSPTALSQIDTKGVDSLNQFFNSAYYWRSTDRFAPHNVYTSSELIAYALRDKYPNDKGTYTSWKYDAVTAGAAPMTIQIDFSSFSYLVEWNYDPTENAYTRLQAGEEHVMEDGSTITASNVIVQYVKTSLEDATRLSMETVGTGDAIIFQNGERIDGSWEKDSVSDRTIFLDDSGHEITLTRGTTWVEVLPTDRSVTVS